MKNKALVAVTAGLWLLMVSFSGIAHHSFSAQFDAEKPIELTGTVTKVSWRNPHAWFYIDVEDDDGNVANWGMELASPNLLMRKGWNALVDDRSATPLLSTAFLPGTAAIPATRGWLR